MKKLNSKALPQASKNQRKPTSKQITIALPENDPSKPAPLFYQYDSLLPSQPAYIQLDLTNGKVTLGLGNNDDESEALQEQLTYGVVQRYPIRNDLTHDQITQVVSELKNDMERVYQHSTIVFEEDYGTHVCKISDSQAQQSHSLLSEPKAGVHGAGLKRLAANDSTQRSERKSDCTENTTFMHQTPTM